MEKEFKVKKNSTVVIFCIVYFVYAAALFVLQNYSDAIVIGCFGIVLLAYFLGFRPYKYTVDRRTAIIYYRLRKNKEIDLMQCETICDPVPRLWELVMRPHAIELYTYVKKRYRFFPKYRVEFIEAILQGNKRIHCTVQDYTDVHRQLGKKLRKERLKAEKAAARERENNRKKK